MIYVDEVFVWSGRRPFDKGSCHMWTDGDLDELHAFAAKIGLKRDWFQPSDIVHHYDLTPRKRQLAIMRGARALDCRTGVKMWREICSTRSTATP